VVEPLKAAGGAAAGSVVKDSVPVDVPAAVVGAERAGAAQALAKAAKACGKRTSEEAGLKEEFYFGWDAEQQAAWRVPAAVAKKRKQSINKEPTQNIEVPAGTGCGFSTVARKRIMTGFVRELTHIMQVRRTTTRWRRCGRMGCAVRSSTLGSGSGGR
jgi:hypothetical protein